MSCSIQNNSGQDMSSLTNMVKRFYPYAQEYLGFDKPAQIVYESDPTNAQDPLGKTAHYQPQNYTVTLYVDGRHPKDLLRSLAHELVHHTQNCRGDLSPEKIGETSDGYAQTDGHLRKMEQEAYASMVMRDWEDQHKSKRRNNLHETIYINKENITMSEHEKLVQSIVAEIMKNATITPERVNEEEDEDVQEEGQGDRNDSDREQGRASSDRRQGTSSGGGAGQNLEEDSKAGKMDRKDVANKATGRWLKEGDDEDEDETVDEVQVQSAGQAGGKADKHRSPKTGKKCYDAKGNQVECGSDKAVKEGKDEDEDSTNEGWDRPKDATGSGPSAKAGRWDRKDVANQVPSGFVNEDEDADDETIEESEESDEETTDDLAETFQRRQEKLYERLIKRWAK